MSYCIIAIAFFKPVCFHPLKFSVKLPWCLPMARAGSRISAFISPLLFWTKKSVFFANRKYNYSESKLCILIIPFDISNCSFCKNCCHLVNVKSKCILDTCHDDLVSINCSSFHFPDLSKLMFHSRWLQVSNVLIFILQTSNNF